MNQVQDQSFDSVVVMGKIHKTGNEPLELRARVAFATCLLYAYPNMILISAGGPYLHDSPVPVAQIVKEWAIRWGIKENRIVTRNESNSTIREVKVIQKMLIQYKRDKPLVISHSYHLRRTKRYFSENGLDIQTVHCSVKALHRAVPDGMLHLLDVIQSGQISFMNACKEYCVETILSLIHTADPTGKFECWLADRVREGNV